MKTRITVALAVALLSSTAPALAGGKHDHDHGKTKATTTAAPAAAADMADGEVRKIDKEAGKVTLKHGEIKSLEMPPMTMVFKVKEAALLDSLKVGDKIKFQAQKIDGSYTVTKVEAAK